MCCEVRYRAIDTAGRTVEPDRMPIDAISLGRGVFETILCLNGNPVFPGRHAARLAASCSQLGVAAEGDVRSIFERAVEFAAEQPIERARLRLALFGEEGRQSPVGLLALRSAPKPKPAVSLVLSHFVRRAESPLGSHKAVDYLENLLALKESASAGFDDALWLDSSGKVAETSVANIFLGFEAGLVTPRTGCILPGIIRQWVIETARKLGLPLAEDEVPASRLPHVRWAFVTNSIIGLVGVSRIGERWLADADETDVFRALKSAYDEELATAAGTSPGP